MKQYKRNGWKRIFTIMTVLVLVLTSVDVTAFVSRVPAQEQISDGEYTAEAIAEPLAQTPGVHSRTRAALLQEIILQAGQRNCMMSLSLRLRQ